MVETMAEDLAAEGYGVLEDARELAEKREKPLSQPEWQ
jgi:hypothetical protein